MAKISNAQLATRKREEVLKRLTEFLLEGGEDVLRESGNAIVFPSTDEAGNDLYIKIAVSIPRGDRSGEAYDGYLAAEDYKLHQEEVAIRREKKKRENAEKAARAKEKREAAIAKKEAEAAKREQTFAEAAQGG